MEVKKALTNLIKEIFSIIYIYIYIYIFFFFYLTVRTLIEELGKLLINPLAKINIFFFYDS